MANPFYYSMAGGLAVTGFLDTVNDVEPGRAVASPTGQNNFRGQLGKFIEIDDQEALRLSSVTTAAGRLLGGRYQYVQLKAGSTPLRGGLVFWDTFALDYVGTPPRFQYVVTSVVTATNITQVAGVMLGTTLAAGNFGWIQTLGVSQALAMNPLTSAAIGNIAFVDVTPTNTFDANTAAAVTLPQLAKKIGVTYQTPVAATVTAIYLEPGGALTLVY